MRCKRATQTEKKDSLTKCDLDPLESKNVIGDDISTELAALSRSATKDRSVSTDNKLINAIFAHEKAKHED